MRTANRSMKKKKGTPKSFSFSSSLSHSVFSFSLVSLSVSVYQRRLHEFKILLVFESSYECNVTIITHYFISFLQIIV